jgi:saccharopepsin
LKLSRILYGLLRKLVPSTFTELILQNNFWLHYNVPIGIGTNPSQLFNAIIDLQWADLWVVSQYCTEHRGCDYHLKYNASKSSTHEPNGTAMHLQFPLWPDVHGYISTDTVMLGESLKVEHHPFVELVHWEGYPHEYDAALGLSPRQTMYGHADDSQPLLPSPFMGLMESKQLEKNSFALLLPYNRHDIGDLSFGTSHPEFHEGPFTSHPIYPENASTWQIEAPSISMRHHNGTEIFKYSFAGVSAQLDSILPPAAWVPNELAQAVLNATNATVDETDCDMPVVPCDKISELPHLVFDFDGQEIVLNGEDYIGEAEWPFCFRGPYCSPLIGYNPRDNDTIVLGPPFLKKVYSVFDWDDRTVSCKSRT